MGTDSGGRSRYASGGAELYDTLGIEGTTHQTWSAALYAAAGIAMGGAPSGVSD